MMSVRTQTSRSAWILALLALICSTQARAQQPSGAGAQSSAAVQQTQNKPGDRVAPSQPKVTLTNFSWLAGRWQGTWGPRIAQQAWTAPQGDVMLGTFQLTESDKTLVLELYTLSEDEKGIQFHLRHFTPSLVAWEKSAPTTLNLESVDAKSISFVNPIDGQPKRVVFTQLDPDTYISRSEVIPEKGDTEVTEITYRRLHDGAPPKPAKQHKHK